MLSFTHPRVVINPRDFLSSVEHKGQIVMNRQTRSPFAFIAVFSVQWKWMGTGAFSLILPLLLRSMKKVTQVWNVGKTIIYFIKNLKKRMFGEIS